MKIAVSKGSGSPKYAYYAQWLTSLDSGIEIIDLSTAGENITATRGILSDCAGLVLTGGEDVDPALYNAPELALLCHRIDRARDEFELSLFEFARQKTMPVLGICRGMQLINVALGGNLIADLPTYYPSVIPHTKQESSDSLHTLAIEPGARLGKMLRCWEGVVNSAHHQAVDRLGDGLTVAARAPDGIIEAIEWHSPETHGFLLGIQWHPERMHDMSLPFSRGIGERFLFECQSYEYLLKGKVYDREHFMTPPSEQSDAGT